MSCSTEPMTRESTADPAVPPRATSHSVPAASATFDTETKRSLGSCFVSFLLHCFVLVVLAFWTLQQGIGIGDRLTLQATVEPAGGGATLEGLTDIDAPPTEFPLEQSTTAQERAISLPPLPLQSIESADRTETPARNDLFSGTGQSRLTEVFERPTGGGWEGRTDGAREDLVRQGGGTGEALGAVIAGLEWLQAHQHDNGSWTFHFDDAPCKGRCRHSSDMTNTTGATGLALLCFLGYGYTHQTESRFQETVDKGIYYLIRRMQPTPHGGDLQEGTMYAQGIAAMALCEAYGMTKDPALREYAQSAIDFICYAQHKKGGWRYSPGQQGDTTVFGWQMMALKSAKMAGLRVPTLVTQRARLFLDSVGSENGAFYGYLTSGKEPTPTAVGLLVRMYTGWPRNHRPLARGVQYLAARGPSKTDMYFNYYANQVMFHYRVGGWTGWNHRLSNYLLRTQARVGHETGSWYFDDPYAEEAGRLYTTCLAIMILEVYYRHMPLYQTESIDGGSF